MADYNPNTASPKDDDNLITSARKIALYLYGVFTGSATLQTSSSSSGLSIPAADYVQINYVGSTNNPDTIVYNTGGSGGTTVATLTFTYIGGVPSTDDANVFSITKS